MSFTVTAAARETGLSKSTISRAIKEGRISAARQEDGRFIIEPAELFRVYSRKVAQHDDNPHHDAPRNKPEQHRVTSYNEAEVLRIKLEMTEVMLSREREMRENDYETISDLRKRLDVATDRVLALTKITQHDDNSVHDAPRNTTQPEVKRGFWSRFLGR